MPRTRRRTQRMQRTRKGRKSVRRTRKVSRRTFKRRPKRVKRQQRKIKVGGKVGGAFSRSKTPRPLIVSQDPWVKQYDERMKRKRERESENRLLEDQTAKDESNVGGASDAAQDASQDAIRVAHTNEEHLNILIRSLSENFRNWDNEVNQDRKKTLAYSFFLVDLLKKRRDGSYQIPYQMVANNMEETKFEKLLKKYESVYTDSE